MKYVVYFCRPIKILISNWPRRRKFSQPLQAGKAVAFDFAHYDHALATLFVQFLCCDWSKFARWVHAENSCCILNLVYFDSWSWQGFVSTYYVFNRLFPLDVQNKIQLPLGVFCYWWLVGYWVLVEKYITCQSRKSDFGWHRFRFSPCLMRKRVEKSEAILALLDSFQCISNGKPE